MFNNIKRKSVIREIEQEFPEQTMIKFNFPKFGNKFYNKHIKNTDIDGFQMHKQREIIYVDARDFHRIKIGTRDMTRIVELYTCLIW